MSETTAAVKEKPILFSAPMIRAIREGRTVRSAKGQMKFDLPFDILRTAYEEGATIQEIADALGVSVQPVKRVFRENHYRLRPGKRRPGLFGGSANPAWKGGRRIRPDGYVVVLLEGEERLEHRVVMERHLGRHLGPEEIVHHIDGDKQNNHPSNLQVMSQSEHAKLHTQDRIEARYGRS